MPHFILLPDSFKGTLSSRKICSIMSGKIREFLPDAQITSIPVADGGEGTVEAFLTALGGRRVEIPVTGPNFEKLSGFYGILPDGKTAVVEMAACAGLPLVHGKRNPEKTTTFGVGELFLDAARNGCTKIIVGLGGSATNDAGTGAAAACGVRFLNASGESFVPTGGTLGDVAKIDASAFDPALRNVEFVTMCDINNPFSGPTGAAYVFAPQKGADDAMVARLDAGLDHIGALMRDVSGGAFTPDLSGAGAAGGMGGGMCAFFGSKLQMGIETVLNTVRFDELVQTADWVFTGEGKIDSQSLRGKVVLGVAARTQKAGVPLIAVVGDVGDEIDEAYDRGVTAIFSINHVAVPFHQARRRAEQDLAAEMENILRLIKASMK